MSNFDRPNTASHTRLVVNLPTPDLRPPMSDLFKCYLVSKDAEGRVSAEVAQRSRDDLPEGEVPITVPIIGAENKPVAPKYVKAIRVCQDGKMEVEMISGQHYAIIDMVKANTMFHQNEGVMLTKIKELMDDAENDKYNRTVLEEEVKMLKRKLKTAKEKK